MMRYSLLSAIALLLVAVSCGDAASEVWPKAPVRCGWGEEMPKLRGAIDSVVISHYTIAHGLYFSGSVDTTKVLYTFKFNRRGDVEESCSYFADGKLYDKKLYKYDAEGRNTELAWYRPEGPFWQRSHFKYDAEGNRVESADYLGATLVDRWLYEYDSQGRMVEASSCDAEGVSVGKVCYRYDSQGRKIEEANYDRESRYKGKGLYKYDAAGNETEYSSYNERGEQRSLISYRYDAKCNRVETIDRADRTTYQYKYDTLGNVVECRVSDEPKDSESFVDRVAEFKIYYRAEE